MDDEEGKDSSRVDIDIDSEGDSNMYPANAMAGTSEAGQAINDEPSSSLTAPGPTMGDGSGSSNLPTSFSKDMFQASLPHGPAVPLCLVPWRPPDFC